MAYQTKMSKEKAEKILGDRDTWELQNMKRALSNMQVLNTEEENERLEAVKVILKERKKK